MLTYFSGAMFTLETNLYLQACHQAEYIRKVLQTSNKRSTFQKMGFKGSGADWQAASAAKEFLQCGGGKGRQLRPWTFLDLLWHRLHSQHLPFPCAQAKVVPNTRRKTGRTVRAMESEDFYVHCSPIGTNLPLKCSRLSLLWLLPWVLSSGSPIHFNIKM